MDVCDKIMELNNSINRDMQIHCLNFLNFSRLIEALIVKWYVFSLDLLSMFFGIIVRMQSEKG